MYAVICNTIQIFGISNPDDVMCVCVRSSMCQTLANGYVSLGNLIPPGCFSAVASTFCPSQEPESGFLESTFGEVVELTVVCHDSRGTQINTHAQNLCTYADILNLSHTHAEKPHFCVISEAQLESIHMEARGTKWLWCLVRPNSGLMHAKVCVCTRVGILPSHTWGCSVSQCVVLCCSVS